MAETTDNVGAGGAAGEGPAASDAALVEMAKAEAGAFGQLFDRYHAMVVNFAFRWTLNAEAAQEIAAETFYKALRGIGQFRGEATFKSWLYRVAMNELRIHWRAGNRQKEALQAWLDELGRASFEGAADDPAKRHEKAEAFAALKKQLEALPDKLREPVLLRYWEGLEYSEIAAALGLTVATARSRVFRGLAKLRQRVRDK